MLTFMKNNTLDVLMLMCPMNICRTPFLVTDVMVTIINIEVLYCVTYFKAIHICFGRDYVK